MSEIQKIDGAAKLKAYLLEMSIKQGDFGASLGLTQSSISRILNNKVTVTLDQAFSIERLTKRSVRASDFASKSCEKSPLNSQYGISDDNCQGKESPTSGCAS